MVRVIVVEDEPASREHIRDLAASFPDVQVIAECADGESAVRAIVAGRPDIVFLDVRLPGLDGFQVLEALPGDVRPWTVFITAHDDFAVRAFDSEAVDYLLKPFGRARFARAMARALERAAVRAAASAPPSPDAPLTRLVVRSGPRHYFVQTADIDWIDVADNYLQLHCAGRTHLVRGTLGDVLPRLDARRFVRIHRGLVVNVDRVVSIEAHAPGVYRLLMSDRARLTSSRSYGDAVRALLR